jgi:cytochrome c556
MTKAEEKRMEKAKALRYRKPAVKDLNLASIREQLTEIEEACGTCTGTARARTAGTRC